MKKLVNGQLVDLTEQEIAEREAQETTWNNGALDRALTELRLDRNKLLADSDWQVTMAKEKGTSLSTAFKNWRQSLRDATDDLTTVDEVKAYEFPTKPE